MNPHTFNIEVYHKRVSPLVPEAKQDFMPPFTKSATDGVSSSTESPSFPIALLQTLSRPKAVAVAAVGILAFSCGKYLLKKALQHFAEKQESECSRQTGDAVSTEPLDTIKNEEDVSMDSKTVVEMQSFAEKESSEGRQEDEATSAAIPDTTTDEEQMSIDSEPGITQESVSMDSKAGVEMQSFAERESSEGKQEDEATSAATPDTTTDEEQVSMDSEPATSQTPKEDNESASAPAPVKENKSDDTFELLEQNDGPEKEDQSSSPHNDTSPSRESGALVANQQDMPEKNGQKEVKGLLAQDKPSSEERFGGNNKRRGEQKTRDNIGTSDGTSGLRNKTKIKFRKGVQSPPFDEQMKNEKYTQTPPLVGENKDVQDAPINSANSRNGNKNQGLGDSRKSQRCRKNRRSKDKRHCEQTRCPKSHEEMLRKEDSDSKVPFDEKFDRFKECFIFNPNKPPPIEEEFIRDFQNFLQGGRTLTFLPHSEPTSSLAETKVKRKKKKNKPRRERLPVNQDPCGGPDLLDDLGRKPEKEGAPKSTAHESPTCAGVEFGKELPGKERSWEDIRNRRGNPFDAPEWTVKGNTSPCPNEGNATSSTPLHASKDNLQQAREVSKVTPEQIDVPKHIFTPQDARAGMCERSRKSNFATSRRIETNFLGNQTLRFKVEPKGRRFNLKQ